MTLSERLRRACLWEATARKPGNVHPQASFRDLTWRDFADAAEAAAPHLARAAVSGVGPAALEAVRATRARVRSNTNLGIVLLLAPLAAVPFGQSLRTGLPRVLHELTQADAEAVYAAIRLANPGGLGTVDREDVSAPPSLGLREVMGLAADRDLIASQYVTDFALVFSSADRLASLLHARGADLRNTSDELPESLEAVIVQVYLEILAAHSDSLIGRKCGIAVAEEASHRAQAVLASDMSAEAVQSFDDWLRADGHRRNPGTTADLIAASLFVVLQESAAG